MTWIEKVTDMGWAMPGALSVMTLPLYCPDWDGAWTVTLNWVVPGAKFPTAIEVAVVVTGDCGPALTDSVQPRIENFVKSPEDTIDALL